MRCVTTVGTLIFAETRSVAITSPHRGMGTMTVAMTLLLGALIVCLEAVQLYDT